MVCNTASADDNSSVSTSSTSTSDTTAPCGSTALTRLHRRCRPLCTRSLFHQLLQTQPKSAAGPGWFTQILGCANSQLQVQADRGSSFGCCVVLYDIYLRDFTGTFAGVPPGQYTVMWRIKLDDVTVGSSTTYAAAVRPCATAAATSDVPPAEGFTSKWEPRQWVAMERAYGKGVWFEAVVGVVTLREQCMVDVRLGNLDVDWKGSVFLDYVMLQPCH